MKQVRRVMNGTFAVMLILHAPVTVARYWKVDPLDAGFLAICLLLLAMHMVTEVIGE